MRRYAAVTRMREQDVVGPSDVPVDGQGVGRGCFVVRDNRSRVAWDCRRIRQAARSPRQHRAPQPLSFGPRVTNEPLLGAGNRTMVVLVGGGIYHQYLGPHSEKSRLVYSFQGRQDDCARSCGAHRERLCGPAGLLSPSQQTTVRSVNHERRGVRASRRTHLERLQSPGDSSLTAPAPRRRISAPD